MESRKTRSAVAAALAEEAAHIETNKPKLAVPPNVITSNTNDVRKEGENEKVLVEQARTPKHANKNHHEVSSDSKKQSEEKAENLGVQRRSYQEVPSAARAQLGGNGAFQPPHEVRRSFHPQSDAYYHQHDGGYRGPPPHGYYNRNAPRMDDGYYEHHGPPGGYFEQRFSNGGPPPGYRGPYHAPPQYSMSGWGPNPSLLHPAAGPYPGSYSNSRQAHQPIPPQHGVSHDGRFTSESSGFSRAVSSSFDRSIKSRSASHDEKQPNGVGGEHPSSESGTPNILAKVEEEQKSPDPLELKQVNSTSSSLTNSPTEGALKLRAKESATEGVAPGLDSLASVSSTQEPIQKDDAKKQKGTRRSQPPPSPDSDAASLDLMKCSSGSSGLLPAKEHDAPFVSQSKRDRDSMEEREEKGNRSDANQDEIRKAPSDIGDKQQPPLKKSKVQAEDQTTKGKETPLSISCSPPSALDKDALISTQPLKKAAPSGLKPEYEESPLPDPPMYSYSLDSAPSFPKEGHRRLPSLTMPRPHSAASATIDKDQLDQVNQMVPSIPSWEIHAQDSFGAGSIGGGQGITSNFSFQDYPMLPNPDSNLGTIAGDNNSTTGPAAPPPPQPPQPAPRENHQPQVETRNQSFEGSHYQGREGFYRSDSMDQYYSGRSGAPPPHDHYHRGHPGQYPPHAPSWGSNASGYPPHGHPGHYEHYGGPMRTGYPGDMMRNYSQDSGHRASPPPGHGHPGFQPPPPEFAAPHNPHLARRPPPAVYIMSSSNAAGMKASGTRVSGNFSWSKEEDVRLTEIMKKYKNPRDWEPIAKEHGAGKTAKECHERWIRYLKPGVRKGQWTDHEDAVVIEAVTNSSEQPFTRWSDLAQRLPGRVGKQIRDRWVNHLNPNINHLPFSREDDLLLWEGHKKLGKRWVEISTKYFNNSRSENHIKNRWYSASFKKFIANEFGPDAYSGGASPSKKKDTKPSKKIKREQEDPTISTTT